jgi:hypothetical protein
MTFNGYAGVLCLACILLSGCPGQDDNVAEPGLSVHFAEVHVEQRLSAGAAAQAASAVKANAVAVKSAAAVAGGYDKASLEHHDIIDGSGHLLSLYRAYLVLDEIELVPCMSLAQLPRLLLDGLIPAARAHAGHGAEPVGGRALDKPNVIDIVTQDEYLLPLGDHAAAPGRYCGVRVWLARFAGDGYGQPATAPASQDDPTTVPDVPDLSGKAFALRADYCALDDGAGTCLMRAKVDIDDDGLTVPAALTLSLDQPLEVNATRRNAYVAIGIAYGEWVHDVDVSLLANDAYEKQKLFDNIAASIHVYSQGLGDLPVNVTQ